MFPTKLMNDPIVNISVEPNLSQSFPVIVVNTSYMRVSMFIIQLDWDEVIPRDF